MSFVYITLSILVNRHVSFRSFLPHDTHANKWFLTHGGQIYIGTLVIDVIQLQLLKRAKDIFKTMVNDGYVMTIGSGRWLFCVMAA